MALIEVPALFHSSVAMVTGEVPARAAEAEGGVGEGAAGGGGGGKEVPRGGGWMLPALRLRANAPELHISHNVTPKGVVHAQFKHPPIRNRRLSACLKVFL